MSECGVKEFKLRELLKIYNGTKYDHLNKGDIPLYGSGGLMSHVNEALYSGEAILLPRKGTLSNIMYVNESFWTVDTMYYAVVNDKLADAFYLYSYLSQLDLSNLDSGSTLPSMTKSAYESIIVKLPDLKIQKVVANFLCNIRKKMEINNQINQELEAMAKTLYDYWFVQFDFPDQNGKPYKSSGGKMVYHPELKREIPEGWGVEKLEKIANITMGQSPKGTSYNEVGEGMLFFQGSTDFGWRFPVARQYTTEPSRIAEEDDILLSVRAPVGTLNIADTRCCIGRGLAAINSKVGANSYIFNVMQDFKKLFDKMNSVGTTFGSITKDDLYSLQLVYPPNELLMRFDQSVKSFDREIKNRSRQNQGLTQLRDWLLPMLMNGQVKVE
ncbi:restriction endonuclease subunit S [Streptococcus thermophilus]|uniref:restriction endonuclease subunit S n=1 Tax=Streptococcus thermophilus TaxID=1308 RepID=UPI0015C221FA|nr:restriction endonuclease subunit S [Streptococcus thermophilus]MCT2941284.1 restriction endonuclease subunit S [Streptococcus thermophilus]MCT2949806.1 restriction endonuclease subunit S [Streptococcus thermophilus]CAD0121586.1 Type I restriction-modification system, specificity subunit S [Streptococcus thermophilus]CAD0132430.1 Type I restriction-modification system, specificity subunit S [Streptococcus thermophilus]